MANYILKIESLNERMILDIENGNFIKLV